MFGRKTSDGYTSPIEGIEQKTLVYGPKTLMTEFHLKKDSILPRHSHPYEQTGYLVQGRLRLYIGSDVYDAQPGDSWMIPGDVEHGADILEDSVALEIFSPAREDYIPKTT